MEVVLLLFFLILMVYGAWATLHRDQTDQNEDDQPLRPDADEETQTAASQQPIDGTGANGLAVTNGIAHPPPPPFPTSMILEGPAYVIDGDTIRIKKIKIRLAGIDAPELDRPWGQASKWEMVKNCKGHRIRVELTGDTSYDRLVGTCYLPDGTDIGAEIVKAGLALDGGLYSAGKYRHLEPAGVRRKIRPFGNQSAPRS